MKQISAKELKAYEAYLKQEERSAGTIEKYLRDVGRFMEWNEMEFGKAAEDDQEDPCSLEKIKERAATWKQSLIKQGYRPVTINSMLAALNTFFRFLGWNECRVKFLRVQKQTFRREERELTRADYEKLLEAASRMDREWLRLLMEAICCTGIRVSEVKYLTVEAARDGRAEIAMKGKIRVILLPGKLRKKLLQYAKKQKIAAGELFLSASGKPLSRKQIWAEMKHLCKTAGVEPTKVFPHNLRHLFARTFYRVCRDLAHLADVLGHSSINTTRIYLATTEAQQIKNMERLQLIS